MHVIVFVPPLLLPPTIATQIPLGLPILRPSVKFSRLVASLFSYCLSCIRFTFYCLERRINEQAVREAVFTEKVDPLARVSEPANFRIWLTWVREVERAGLWPSYGIEDGQVGVYCASCHPQSSFRYPKC